MTEPVLVERRGDVVVWTLNNPEARNPISDFQTIDELRAAVAEVDRDDSVRVAVLTGAGSAFSSGGNVKHMRDKEGMFAGTPAELREGYRRGIQRIPKALYHCAVPTIAAVNGPAVGAGCDLALMCDLRIASTTAKFAESFVKLGIIPGDGGAWFMQRQIGYQRAFELTLSGRVISADEALAYGVVLEVVEPEQLMEAALAHAKRIAAHPPKATRLTKRLMKMAPDMELKPFLDVCAVFQGMCHNEPEHLEAVERLLARMKR